MDNDARALALKAQRNLDSSTALAALQNGLRRGESAYLTPEHIPWLGVPDWAATTAVTIAPPMAVHQSGKIYWCLKAGTTGSSGPAAASDPFASYISDGSTYWSYAGRRAPMARSAMNSGVVYVGDTIIHLGSRYIVDAAGTLAGSTPGSLGQGQAVTDGTATLRYLGAQDLPVVTLASSADGALTQSYAWNHAAMSYLGGDVVQITPNPRCTIVATDNDGSGSYSQTDGGGPGSKIVSVSANLVEQHWYSSGMISLWEDGLLVAYLYDTNTATWKYITINNAGRALQKRRDYRFQLQAGVQLGPLKCLPGDMVAAPSGDNSFRLITIGDSFLEGQSQIYLRCYAARLGHRLGATNHRNAALGGCGWLYTPGGGKVNMSTRFAFDVLQRSPHMVIMEMSQNDLSGINAGTYTAAQLVAAVAARLDELLALPLKPLIAVVGMWQNRGPLSSLSTLYPAVTGQTAYQINQAIKAVVDARNIPWIERGELVPVDTGYAGTTTSAQTPYNVRIVGDGTHPSLLGSNDLLSNLIDEIKRRFS